jgi:hypothetical protein
MIRLGIVPLLVTLVACAEAPITDEPSGAAGGKADGSLTTITFDRDWNESANGTLEAGSVVRVAYDLDRLTTCRGSTNGSDVWGITGWAMFDDGTPEAFAVSQLQGGRAVPVTAELEIPARAHVVELWFQITNRWGCNAYDSNFGGNYVFELE